MTKYGTPINLLAFSRQALLLLGTALLLLGFQANARAEANGIEQATKQVIEGQLEAFRNDDGETAFSFATQNIQVMFENPGRFLEMVKADYNVVYRPTTVEFVRFEASEEVAWHTVQMVDASKTLWNVYYRLINTGKTGWKISSCQIAKVQAELI